MTLLVYKLAVLSISLILLSRLYSASSAVLFSSGVLSWSILSSGNNSSLRVLSRPRTHVGVVQRALARAESSFLDGPGSVLHPDISALTTVHHNWVGYVGNRAVTCYLHQTAPWCPE